MNLKETETLLREMFAIDGRRLEAEKIAAWKESLSSMQLDVAQAALRKCRADDRINYVEPRHIWAKAKDTALELDRQAQQAAMAEEESQATGTPCPTCKHKKMLIVCDVCCNAMMKFHQTHEHQLNDCTDLCHAYAKENLLA